MNLMVLRGDISPDAPPKDDFHYASDLADFIKKRDPEFNLMGACYPEGHYQAASLEEDVQNLHHKIANGVTHLVTQLFFDNEAFYRFRDMATAQGIDVPIVAGIMPITSIPADRTHRGAFRGERAGKTFTLVQQVRQQA